MLDTVGADTDGSQFFLVAFAMGGTSELRVAANALGTQLGLPLTRLELVPPR